jgi:integrase
MPIQKNTNPHAPKKGATIKVEPIRSVKDIKSIKKLLSDHPRNFCLFTLGINTAYRANELLSITVGQVAHLEAGGELDLKQSKNKKYRRVSLNESAVDSVQSYLDWKQIHETQACADDDFLFTGQRGPITVNYLNNLVKAWCKTLRIPGNYGSHSLRKTFGYQLRVLKQTPVALLMEIFGHATQKQTLEYLGIQDKEIKNIFMDLNL